MVLRARGKLWLPTSTSRGGARLYIPSTIIADSQFPLPAIVERIDSGAESQEERPEGIDVWVEIDAPGRRLIISFPEKTDSES
jgi:hypothetical protein